MIDAVTGFNPAFFRTIGKAMEAKTTSIHALLQPFSTGKPRQC